MNSVVKMTAGFGFVAATSVSAAAANFIDLGGPGEGYFALWNAANGEDEARVQSRLADYPYFQLPATRADGSSQSRAGLWTKLIASPLDNNADYSDIEALWQTPPTITRSGTTQPGLEDFSVGRIDYDNSLVSPTGTSNVGVNDLDFDFNIFEWDGSFVNSSFQNSSAPLNISPFSPAPTPFNTASGAGDAQFIYFLELSNVQGDGLTFVDGELTGMDIQGDIEILINLAAGPKTTSPFQSATIDGTFSSTPGLGFEIDAAGIRNIFVFQGLEVLVNRSGTASVVPEPAAAFMLIGGLGLALRRRRPRTRV